MKLGTGKVRITPPVGVMLAGFAFRDHGSESVLDELELQAFWLEDDRDPGECACIVTADIIGFDATLTSLLRDDLRQRFGIEPDRLLLCASHTHSGPQTCAKMIGVGTLVENTLSVIREGVRTAVGEARESAVPVAARYGCGMCSGYAINRRLVEAGKAHSGPNPDGVRDDAVSVLSFADANGRLKAVLFHFTCHPTTMGNYLISSEYPGYARRQIEKTLGNGVVVGFLPGCFGDVRPDCTLVGHRQFRRGQPEDVAAFGSALADSVLTCIQPAGGARELPLDRINGRVTAANLTYSRIPSREELQRASHSDIPIKRQWAEQLLGRGFSPTCPLNIQRLDVGPRLTLLAMGGEICCDYGLYARTLGANRFVIPLGYTNGLVGYIPSARMFPEGGYEVEDSTLYFGLPARFSPSIDGEIREACRQLMWE